MKKKILLLMGILSFGIIYSQVGINTKTPQGIFHIDGKGNTSGTANIKDDIIVASDGASGVNVAIGGIPTKGASIALYSNNKGFVPNVVKLASALDVTAVSEPVTGMVVYNPEASGTYPDNTLPGYYMYNGTRWKRLRTQAYLGVSETRTLKTAVTTASTTTTTADAAPSLDFGDITIYEDGAYAFSFNVYAKSSTGALAQGITRGVFYIHILKKSSNENNFSLLRTIEISPSLFPNGQSFSITGIGGVELKSQDQIKFTTRHYSSYNTITYYTGATYVMYWQI